MGNSKSKSPEPTAQIPKFSTLDSSHKLQNFTSVSQDFHTNRNLIDNSHTALSSNYVQANPGHLINNTVQKPSRTNSPDLFTTNNIIIPAPEKVHIKANQVVLCSVNNYIISNESQDNSSTFDDLSIPYGFKVDRYSMRVCPQYNSKKGCFSGKYCYRIHACQFWIKGLCKKEDCCYNHGITKSPRCQQLLQSFWRPRFNEENMLEILKTGSYSIGKKAIDICDYVCLDDLAKKCHREPCKFVHINPYNSFVWEVNIEDSWKTLPTKYSIEIETEYCSPSSETASLCIDGDRGILNNVSKVFKQENGTVNFDTMSLTLSNSFFRVRRLSTPSDILRSKAQATRWLWYWQDETSSWRYYTNATVTVSGKITFLIIPFSDYIEMQYLKGIPNFKADISNHTCTIDFVTMTQTNEFTQTKCDIKRRPSLAIKKKWDDASTFRSLWNAPSYPNKYCRQSVSSSSPEYYFVKSLITKSLPEISDAIIERVENPFLWQSYQIKKGVLLKSYIYDEVELNEQYLFHGTKSSVVDKICSENFDWRLFGSSTGFVYGQGTYFANTANYSKSYAGTDENGYHCMFIAYVLVGTATVGDSEFNIPPLNKATNKRFDTTVDSLTKPSLFVKYNKDEYYPAYYIKFKYRNVCYQF